MIVMCVLWCVYVVVMLVLIFHLDRERCAAEARERAITRQRDVFHRVILDDAKVIENQKAKIGGLYKRLAEAYRKIGMIQDICYQPDEDEDEEA